MPEVQRQHDLPENETITFGKNQYIDAKFHVKNHPLKRTDVIIYLGLNIPDKWDRPTEIMSHIEKARCELNPSQESGL